MAREYFRLTDRIVRSLTAPGHCCDGAGLYLQLSPAGTKSWIFRFASPVLRHPDGRGKQRDMGLGPAPLVSLAEARAKAAEARALVGKGIDPIENAKAQKALVATAAAPVVVAVPVGPTFREFAEDYIAQRRDGWRNENHRAQWTATLKQYAFPIIGDMQLDAIDTPHVLQIIEPMWKEKSETASRVRGRIERILAAASVRGLRPATNPALWRGHLAEALPPKAKAKHFAALPYAEVPAFMAHLATRQGVGGRALEFTILTAARSGETRGARWAEIDEAERLWAVPAERTKANREHRVPLSDAALAILQAVKPLRDLSGGLIFPGYKGGALSDMTLSKLVRDMHYPVTVHGFRSSFRDWAGNETNFQREVAEAALAHILGDAAEKAYRRGDALDKRRPLMQAWGDFCASRPASNVIPLKVAAS